MKKADIAPMEAPAMTVDEAIANYRERLTAFRKAKNYEGAVALHNEFDGYIETLSGEDREKALDVFIRSL